jgi:hypothetical protein
VATLPTEARFLVDPDGIVDFHASMETAWSPFAFDVKIRRLERLLHDLGRTGWIGRIAGTAGPNTDGTQSARAGLMRRERSTGLRHFVVGMLPRYWGVDLEASCPRYQHLVRRLLDELIAFTYPGRWIGSGRFQDSSIVFGPPDVAESLRSFCRSLVSCVCERAHATHFVEDTPFYLLAFDRILQLLPEARLVHIHRDPRDVAASYLGKPWSPSDPVKAATFYLDVMRRWERVRDSLPSGAYSEISLEDLVREPEGVLRKLCEFWGLRWHPALLDVDLTKSHSGRWRRDIPPAIVPQLEEMLASFIERYGA